jgi:hypothetical protein
MRCMFLYYAVVLNMISLFPPRKVHIGVHDNFQCRPHIPYFIKILQKFSEMKHVDVRANGHNLPLGTHSVCTKNT